MADSWWGTYDIPIDGIVRWTIGPLELFIARRAEEWCIGERRQDDASLDRYEFWQGTLSEHPPPEGFEEVRYGVSTPSATIELRAALPDRFVVVRPLSQLRVAPEEAITLFASIPVFVQICLPNAAQPLVEIPTYRLSDTWFGPNTISGEFCYALRVKGRLHLDNILRAPHRAIATIMMRNRSPTVLSIERLRVPVEGLRLFCDADHRLWTDEVTLSRQNEGETTASVTPTSRGPTFTQVAEPRRSSNLITRALGSFFDGPRL